VVDRAADVTDPAGRQDGLLDLRGATRVATVVVEVDRCQHAPLALQIAKVTLSDPSKLYQKRTSLGRWAG